MSLICGVPVVVQRQSLAQVHHPRSPGAAGLTECPWASGTEHVAFGRSISTARQAGPMMRQTVTQLNNVPGGSGCSGSKPGGAGAGDWGGGAGGGGAAGTGDGGGAAGIVDSGGAAGTGGGAAGTGDGGGAAGTGDGGGAAGAEFARTRLAVKVAAWSTIPDSSYCMCALKSVPLEQTRSSGTHKSMVFGAYSGPTSTGG